MLDLGPDSWAMVGATAILTTAIAGAIAWLFHRRRMEQVTRELLRELATRRDAQLDMERVNAALEARVDARTHELARSNKELERFAYAASHDLREPLRTVTSYTQLLARRYQSRLDGEALEFIEFAVEGCQRMRQLIHDLLEYSRAGRNARDIELVSVGGALERVKRNLAAALEECGATLEHGALPHVRCSRSSLELLLQNLISNAIKYRSKDRPRVEILATQDEHEVTMSVRDNGIGFEMKHAQRVFGVFQRLHGPGTYPGTGIGLAICEKIMRSHGGRIWVDSIPGEGTTFYCAFPRARSPASS